MPIESCLTHGIRIQLNTLKNSLGGGASSYLWLTLSRTGNEAIKSAVANKIVPNRTRAGQSVWGCHFTICLNRKRQILFDRQWNLFSGYKTLTPPVSCIAAIFNIKPSPTGLAVCIFIIKRFPISWVVPSLAHATPHSLIYESLPLIPKFSAS